MKIGALQIRIYLALSLLFLVTSPQNIPAPAQQSEATPVQTLSAASAGQLPAGYEGQLDDLRSLTPLWREPLSDPIGLAVSASGTTLYVIEKGLHRLSRVEIDPLSPTYTQITAINDSLEDPQKGLALNTAQTHAYIVENGPGRLKSIRLSDGLATTIATGLDHPTDVALSNDESTAYITEYPGSLVSVNLSSYITATISTGLENPTALVLSADGTKAYVSELRGGPLRQVVLSTGAVSDFGNDDINKPYDIAESPTENAVYLVDHKEHLIRVDLSNGDTQRFIEQMGERMEALAFSPDGATLYTAPRGAGRLLRVEVSSKTITSVFPYLQIPTGLALNRAGTRLYILEMGSGEISCQDVDPGSASFGIIETLAQGVINPEGMHGPSHYSLAVNEAETWALVPYTDELRQVDLNSGAVSTVVDGQFNDARGVALSADGKTAYVSDCNGIWQVNTSGWTADFLAPVGYCPYLLTLSADQAYIYAARYPMNSYDTSLLVRVRLEDGHVDEIPGGAGQPSGLALSWDGKHLILGDYQEGGAIFSVALPGGATTQLAKISDWAMMEWPEVAGVAAGPNGAIYIAADNWMGDHVTQNGVIYILHPGQNWRLGTLYKPRLYGPEGIKVSADGNWLYAVASGSLKKVQVMAGDQHGAISTVIHKKLSNPRGVALLADGSAAWVVDFSTLHKVSLSDGSLQQVIHYGASSGIAEFGLGLSTDESKAYLTSKANELVEIDLGTEAVRVMTPGLNSPYDAAVNAAGTHVYVADRGNNRVVAVDIATGLITWSSTNVVDPVAVALDEPNNQVIVLEAPYPYHHIAKVNLTSGTATRVYSSEKNYREEARGLALNPGHTIAYISRTHAGEIWGVDLTSGQVVDPLVEGLSGPTGLDLTGGGSGAFLTEEFVPRMRHANLSTGVVSTTAVMNAPGAGLALSADEGTAYLTRPYVDDLIKVDTTTGITTTIQPDCSHGRAALDPSGDYAYVSCISQGIIWKVDLSDNSRVELVSGLFQPYSLAINAAGTKLYTTVGAVGEPGDFDLYAVSLPGGGTTRIATIEEGQDAPGDITLSNDGNYIYVYDQFGSSIGAGVWQVDVNPGSPNYGQVVAMARWMGEMLQGRFTPDGDHLVMTNAYRHQILDLCVSDDCIPLAAGFSAAPVWGYAPLEVAFYDNSQGAYGALEWDFGDGITSTLTSPTHTFTASGLYTITLTVSGPGGGDQETKASCIQVHSKIFLPLVIR